MLASSVTSIFVLLTGPPCSWVGGLPCFTSEMSRSFRWGPGFFQSGIAFQKTHGESQKQEEQSTSPNVVSGVVLAARVVAVVNMIAAAALIIQDTGANCQAVVRSLSTRTFDRSGISEEEAFPWVPRQAARQASRLPVARPEKSACMYDIYGIVSYSTV